MPKLKNERHEKFARAVAEGKHGTDAYVLAGYDVSVDTAAANASQLLGSAKVFARVQELRTKHAQIEERATERAIERAVQKTALSKEKVLLECARLAFSDIRRAVEWRSDLAQFKPSDEIDDDTAAAISEVRSTPTGGLSIKFRDKMPALAKLGEYFGLWSGEKSGGDTNVNISQTITKIASMSENERARRVILALELAARQAQQELLQADERRSAAGTFCGARPVGDTARVAYGQGALPPRGLDIPRVRSQPRYVSAGADRAWC